MTEGCPVRIHVEDAYVNIVHTHPQVAFVVRAFAPWVLMLLLNHDRLCGPCVFDNDGWGGACRHAGRSRRQSPATECAWLRLDGPILCPETCSCPGRFEWGNSCQCVSPRLDRRCTRYLCLACGAESGIRNPLRTSIFTSPLCCYCMAS